METIEVDWSKEHERTANTPLSYTAKKAVENMIRKGLIPLQWMDSKGNILRVKDRAKSLLK
ncbi:hypothetical protein LCGC14_0846530 [marine sediment metagenome]|uniref:Uncharacterized protein n=1 Tax=marine sediment metagenome TaxID=412755 RepID=A0A0F9PBG6_9ZZZZ